MKKWEKKMNADKSFKQKRKEEKEGMEREKMEGEEDGEAF